MNIPLLFALQSSSQNQQRHLRFPKDYASKPHSATPFEASGLAQRIGPISGLRG
jgi:hypothetical protein